MFIAVTFLIMSSMIVIIVTFLLGSMIVKTFEINFDRIIGYVLNYQEQKVKCEANCRQALLKRTIQEKRLRQEVDFLVWSI